MEAILRATMNKGKSKEIKKVLTILSIVLLVYIFRNVLLDGFTTLFNDIMLLMWNIAGYVDKIIFGVNVT